MYARVARNTGQAGQGDAAAGFAREQVAPAWRKQAGFQGGYILMDRPNGRTISLSLWDTEANAKAASTALTQLAAQAAQ